MCFILTADVEKRPGQCAHGLCARGSVSVTLPKRNLTLQYSHLCLYELIQFTLLIDPVDTVSSAVKDVHKTHMPG